MSAATSCYWCYRCSRYVRILAGGDLPVVCPECGSGFLLKFGHRQPRRNNDGDTGDRSQINLDGTERYCAVCQEALELENEFNEVREMPCKHIYHSHCILQWLEQRNHVPCAGTSCRWTLQQWEGSPAAAIGSFLRLFTRSWKAGEEDIEVE